MKKWTQKMVDALVSGKHSLGDGLLLRISDKGDKRWFYRYTKDGKAREMALKGAETLIQARAAVAGERRLKQGGVDPLEVRRKAAATKTFRQHAADYIDSHKAGWKNPKHAAQWPSTLETYVYPIIGDLQCSAVTTENVLKILRPIWSSKSETASRVRGRIETVLDYAAVIESRGDSPNPARWRGHLIHVLGRLQTKKLEHQASLPYAKVPDFIGKLDSYKSISSEALEFLILTCVRTMEGLAAPWPEFDLEKRLWTIPGARMKSGLVHRVPLSDPAMAVLTRMEKIRVGMWVFPSVQTGKHIGDNALLQLIKGWGFTDENGARITIHGFRSTFRVWAEEQTNYPRTVTEAALAHTNADKVEAAYQRSDLLEKRADLMRDWGAFCR